MGTVRASGGTLRAASKVWVNVRCAVVMIEGSAGYRH